MLLERTLEQQIKTELENIDSLSGYVITTSRDSVTEDKDCKGVIAVTNGFRLNDSFSLSPISINSVLTIATRVEQDATSDTHEDAVETIADKLSYWHKVPESLSCLESDKFMCGELRMDGGSGRKFDSSKSLWIESISFTLRGAEKFN